MAKNLIDGVKGRTRGALVTAKGAAAKAGASTATGANALARKASAAAAAVAATTASLATGVSTNVRSTARRVADAGTSVATMTRERHEAKQAESAANTEAKRREIADKLSARRTWRRVALLIALAGVLIGASMLIEPALRIVHTLIQR